MSTLFKSYDLAGTELANRVVMAPMTRARALNDIPDEHTIIYYAQRASAGLIISEGIPISREGCGYLFNPGLYSDEQTKAWRRVTDGRQRPLGIASLEDKIVQQAVVTVLNTIHEEDLLGFSYGFRPGRSQHDALDALTVALKSQKVNWILDADITSFFDEIDHEWMLLFLGPRIADRRLLGLICK